MREARSENFIEIWHEDTECTSNWIATRGVHHWKDWETPSLETWQLNGTNLHIHDIEEIKALRKLLDAVEERILEERN